MICQRLKALKEERKLTNQQLSDLSGVPVGTISRIMSGQTENPTLITVVDLVRALDGSLDELTGLSKRDKKPVYDITSDKEINRMLLFLCAHAVALDLVLLLICSFR